MRQGNHWRRCWGLALVVAGCYRFTPVESPAPGMEVRAQLQAEAAARRSQGLEEPILRYDGRLVEVTPETLALDVLVARSTSIFQDVEIRDTVRLQRSEVRVVLERSLSPARTALFTVAVGAAATAVVLGIDAVVGGTGDDPGGGDPPAIHIPVFSWVGSRLMPAILRVGREE